MGPDSLGGRVEFSTTCRLSAKMSTCPPFILYFFVRLSKSCRRWRYAPRSAWVDDGELLPFGMRQSVLNISVPILRAQDPIILSPMTLLSSAAWMVPFVVRVSFNMLMLVMGGCM